jgi:phosphate transport system substrate-binding protein
VDPRIPRYEPCAISVPTDASWLTGERKARISGSDHGRWIVERCCASFTALHPDVAFDVDLRGTPSAMAFLMNGKSMFSVMGREITPVETVPYRKLIGAPPVAIRVAHTAEETSQHLATSLAVYVHRSNPLTRITTSQLSKIFSVGNPDGDYSRWSQLGLTGEWAKRQIHPIGTPEYTGFGTYMQAHHLEGRPLSPVYERYVGTDDVLSRLEADPSGVAVAAIGRETSHLRLLPIARDDDGAYSSGSTGDVQNDRYAFGRFLYFYVPQKKNEPVDPFTAEYLRYVLSFEGQSILAEQPGGYIPLRPDEVATERARLDQILLSEGN